MTAFPTQATSKFIPPSTVYFEGRFSNGPVWIEYLATGLGLPTPEASLRGGNNFAYGGAQTGDGGSTIFHSVPNVGSPILAFMELGKTIDDTDLVVVWAGHNDLFGGLSPAAAATNLGSHISALHGEGARSFLVGNFVGVDGAGELNRLFAQEVSQLRQALPDSSITVFDFNSLMVDAFFSPGNFG